MIERIKKWARDLKSDIVALSFALRHPGTPPAAKVLGAVVLVYALSPIDLIPDFIPVLGYLDDLILVPLGLLLVRRMIPEEIMLESRRQAAAWLDANGKQSGSLIGAAIVVSLWFAGAFLLWRYFFA